MFHKDKKDMLETDSPIRKKGPSFCLFLISLPPLVYFHGTIVVYGIGQA